MGTTLHAIVEDLMGAHPSVFCVWNFNKDHAAMAVVSQHCHRGWPRELSYTAEREREVGAAHSLEWCSPVCVPPVPDASDLYNLFAMFCGRLGLRYGEKPDGSPSFRVLFYRM